MIVLKFYMVHQPTKGPKSICFRNTGIQDGCHDDHLGLGKFGLSVVGDEGDTYVDSGRRLYLLVVNKCLGSAWGHMRKFDVYWDVSHKGCMMGIWLLLNTYIGHF